MPRSSYTKDPTPIISPPFSPSTLPLTSYLNHSMFSMPFALLLLWLGNPSLDATLLMGFVLNACIVLIK